MTLVPDESFLEVIIDATEKGPRNIPKIKFIDDVETLLKDRNVDAAIRAMQQFHSKYQYMEASLLTHKKTLTGKLKDINDALQSVSFLLKKKEEGCTTPLDTHFVLSDNVFSRASVTPSDSVFLWLGASTLLEYPLEDAKALLGKNQENAVSTIQNLQESLQFLRCQLTTTEVNIARVHNYGVMLRRQGAPTAPSSPSFGV